MAEEEVKETGEELAPPAETTEQEPEKVESQEPAAGESTGAKEEERDNRVAKGLESALAAERQRRRELEERLRAEEPPESKPKPRLEDYDDQEKYFEDLADWKVDERARDAAKKTAETRKSYHEEALKRDIAALNTKGRQQYPDWDATVSGHHFPVNEAMRDVMLQIENGEQVFYHLGKNPALAVQIADLPPYISAIALAKVAEQVKGPPARTKTSAPAPAKGIGPGETPVKRPEDMSTGEYIAWKNRQEYGA